MPVLGGGAVTDTIPQQAATRANAFRVAELRAALDNMRKFQHSMAPPDPVLITDMRMNALDEIYTHTDWEEFRQEADAAYIDSRAALEQARVETVRLEEAKVGHPDNGESA